MLQMMRALLPFLGGLIQRGLRPVRMLGETGQKEASVFPDAVAPRMAAFLTQRSTAGEGDTGTSASSLLLLLARTKCFFLASWTF